MAAQAEAELCVRTKSKSRRDRGPLHGIPISLKDNIYTKDIRTTGGSKILKDFVPLHDAPVVAALKKAGAVILGKTNMHEFAYGVDHRKSAFWPHAKSVGSRTHRRRFQRRLGRGPGSRACVTAASARIRVARSESRLRCAALWD